MRALGEEGGAATHLLGPASLVVIHALRLVHDRVRVDVILGELRDGLHVEDGRVALEVVAPDLGLRHELLEDRHL
jgi:hypothetical protein